jgi:hypothetical protein
MATYSMTCACGDKFTVDADDREGAVMKLKGMMNEGAIKAHYEDKHPGEEVPTVTEVEEMIEGGTEEAESGV